MPYTVAVSFDRFLESISISGDQKSIAASRRDRIVSLLEHDFTILEAFATGSIPKGTAVKDSDLDVMVALHYGKHCKNKNPSEVLKAVQSSLAEYRTGVRRNGQAVTLYYESWPNVDIVPVFQSVDAAGSITHYNVPDMNTETWLYSRPKTHANNIAQRAASFGAEFLKIIRMIKWWNLQHSDYLQSYHIEALALKALAGKFSDYAWSVYWFFDKALELIDAPLWYEGVYVDSYLSGSDKAEVMKRLETAKAKALDAWYWTANGQSDHKKAIESWRQLFGDSFPSYG